MIGKLPETTDSTIDVAISAAFPNARIVRHTPLEGGVSANVTLIEIETLGGETRKCVLREHGSRHCGHPAKLEFDLLSALHKLDLPVAQPFAFHAGDGAANEPWVLIEYIEGETPNPVDKPGGRIDTMAEQLCALHSAATETLPDLPLRIDPQPELLEFLPEGAEWNGLRQTLLRLGPQPFSGTLALLHGDYWPANIIVRDDAIEAVIDWEDAALGDPLSDVACAQLELRYIHGEWGAQRFAAAYAGQRPLDPHRFALWQAYVAAAGASNMGQWGLPPEQVAAMRAVALQTIREAARALSA